MFKKIFSPIFRFFDRIIVQEAKRVDEFNNYYLAGEGGERFNRRQFTTDKEIVHNQLKG